MPSFRQYLVPSRVLPSVRLLAAIAVLGFLAVASAGSSARVSGEVNAALQTQGARTVALVLIATPIVLALRSRPTPATTIE